MQFCDNFTEARGKSDYYWNSKSALFCFLHAIERYLNARPLNNEILNGKEKENAKHKPAIEIEDLMHLKSSQVLH